jgi:ABC-2 type transport system ATP-binding protein
MSPADAAAAGKIGGMIQTGGLPEGARVCELIALFRQLYRGRRSQDDLLRLAGLTELADRRVEQLSGGQTQRVRFALALAGRPELLFLDEPTAALDVAARRGFWPSVQSIAGQGTTVLFATHYLDEADANASRIIVVSRGRVLADGTPAQIKAYTSVRTIRFSTPAPDTSVLLGLPGVSGVSADGDAVTIRSGDADATLPACTRWPARFAAWRSAAAASRKPCWPSPAMTTAGRPALMAPTALPARRALPPRGTLPPPPCLLTLPSRPLPP